MHTTRIIFSFAEINAHGTTFRKHHLGGAFKLQTLAALVGHALSEGAKRGGDALALAVLLWKDGEDAWGSARIEVGRLDIRCEAVA